MLKAEGKTKQAQRPLRLEWIEAGSLAENPKNWRRHPDSQVAALKDVLADPEIGWAGACLYNERTKHLIDGHARRNAVDPSTPIPVLVGNWSEAAEKKILLTLDPLAGMAEADPEALRSLLDEVSLDSEALKSLGEGLEKLIADGGPLSDESAGGGDQASVEIHDSFQVVIECRDEADQRTMFDRLTAEGRRCRVLTL